LAPLTSFCGGGTVTVPVPVCPVAVTPEALSTLKVPVPTALMLNVPSFFVESLIPVIVMLVPTRSGGPESGV